MLPAESAVDAAWLVARMTTFGGRVGDVTPRGFAAYARVFHPLESGSWAELAAAHGKVMHPGVQWERIAGGSNQLPRIGRLGAEAASELSAILAGHTNTPELCFFAVWEGWGGLEVDPAAAMVCLPYRNYLLHHGALRDADHSFESFNDCQANLWWPADYAWCVASEIDFDSTIVAGTRGLIDAVLASELEALEVTEQTDLSSLGDHLNG